MFDLKDAEIKDAEIKDEEAEMIFQNRKWCHCAPRLLANLIRENKMVAICRASKYIKVFHGIKHYDYGSTATTKRHSYSVRFFRLLCSQTGRIRRNFNCSNYEKFEESYWSYAQEINLIGYLHQLLGILNELRCHGKVGRPRFLVKFPTVIGQVLTVPCYHNNSLGSRLRKPVHIPLGFFCSSLEVTL